MAKLSSLRASDSDRDEVAERLRCATAEGRLTAEELEKRLEVVFVARTCGELDALLADLPRRQRVPVARWAGALSGMVFLVLLGRLAARRGCSDDAPVAAGRWAPVGSPGPLVDPHDGLTVMVSTVRLSYRFAGMRCSPLEVDALQGPPQTPEWRRREAPRAP